MLTDATVKKINEAHKLHKQRTQHVRKVLDNNKIRTLKDYINKTALEDDLNRIGAMILRNNPDFTPFQSRNSDGTRFDFSDDVLKYRRAHTRRWNRVDFLYGYGFSYPSSEWLETFDKVIKEIKRIIKETNTKREHILTNNDGRKTIIKRFFLNVEAYDKGIWGHDFITNVKVKEVHLIAEKIYGNTHFNIRILTNKDGSTNEESYNSEYLPLQPKVYQTVNKCLTIVKREKAKSQRAYKRAIEKIYHTIKRGGYDQHLAAIKL